MADIMDEPKPLTAQEKVLLYEQNGAAKLFYSLNRKMNEMADLMNNNNLGTMAIDDPKSKTFDRLKIIWQDAASIATAVEALGKIAKVTGREDEDVAKKPFSDTIAEERR
jgi:hypothetical protein